MKPHLVIYLDVPVPVIQKRIKERNFPHEVNSKVFKQQYLSDMEYFYKQRYLKEIGLVKTISSYFEYIACCQIQNLEMCLFIHSVFSLTTGPKAPPKRCLHIVRSRASSFK